MAHKKKGVASFIADNYALCFLFFALLLASFQTLSGAPAVESFLASFLLFNVGIQGIFAGVAHWHRPVADNVARKIGWLPGSPFQKEVAAGNIAIGVIGILSYWMRGDFMTAAAISSSIMLFMMGVVHLLDRKNKAVYNSGTVLLFDLLLPLAMLFLLALWKLGY